MLFNSWQFFIFFPVVTTLYFVLPHKYRWVLLLAASCIFYAAFVPSYLLILAVTIVIDFFAGMYIEKTIGKKRKLFLIISLVANIGILAFFKYFNFFNDNFTSLAHFLGWNYPIHALKILLPIGLSFHTFQAMSYTIEVYRGKQKAEKHLGIYALYVMFYPQLVAGPIERPQNMLHQFYEYHRFEYQRVVDGLKLMVWGLFKKVVIADRLSILVDQVYSNPTEFTGFQLLLATLLFAFQIYCDFSGYSDIAIGSAQVMGFKLMDNFNRPYFSKSIAEFWKRWHISLSTWFKDYVYIPLGGNRVGKWRWQFNIFIVFLLSGFWHGASWTYVLWGALNGFYLIFSVWTERLREKIVTLSRIQKVPFLYKLIRTGITFSLICFAWIFFRARNVHEAWYIVTHLFTGLGSLFSLQGVQSNLRGLGFDRYDYVIAFLAIACMEIVHLVQRHGGIRHTLSTRPAWMRWAAYYAIVIGIILFGVFNKSQFIYFQF